MGATFSLRDTLLAVVGSLPPPATSLGAELREQACSHLGAMVLPGRKVEAWKYTRVEALADPALWSPARSASAVPPVVPGVVIIPGVTVPGEIAPGVHWEQEDTPAALEANRFAGVHPFSLLADLASVRYRLRVTRAASPTLRLVLMNACQTPGATHLSLDVSLAAGSSAVLLHCIQGEPGGATLHNEHVRVSLADNARLQYLHWELAEASVNILSAVSATLARDAHLSFHQASLGGPLIRNDRHIVFTGTGSEASLDGFYLAGQGQHVDNHVTLEHCSGQSRSDTTFKGLLRGDGKAVFNGRIHIHPGAQKTAAHLNNRNLMLSREAEVDTKPELEIYADDVQCSHGASIGQLDPNALFYFESRGIDKASAEAMLSAGFIRDIIARLGDEEAAEMLGDLCQPFIETAANGGQPA